MSTEANPSMFLDIPGKTFIAFAMRERYNWGYYIHFRFKALVTTIEMPLILPNFELSLRAPV